MNERLRNHPWADPGRPSLQSLYEFSTTGRGLQGLILEGLSEGLTNGQRRDMTHTKLHPTTKERDCIKLRALANCWLTTTPRWKQTFYADDSKRHPHACRMITLPGADFLYDISTDSLRILYEPAVSQYMKATARQTVMHGGLFNNSYIYIYIYICVYICIYIYTYMND